MAYDRQSYGERSRDRLGEDSVGGEIEEEPSELDQPEGLFDEDDDLEGEALEIVGEELDDDDEEPASPLAEDATPKQQARGKRKAKDLEEDEAGYQLASTTQEEEDIDDAPGVRTSGGSDVSVMNHSDRRREFPSIRRRKTPGRRGRKSRPARA